MQPAGSVFSTNVAPAPSCLVNTGTQQSQMASVEALGPATGGDERQLSFGGLREGAAKGFSTSVYALNHFADGRSQPSVSHHCGLSRGSV